MATKRGDKSKHELVNLANPRKKEDDFIERLVLPTDSLQGIALLYNTSISELKKLNHFHTDADLHARRIIKVPAKGILIDLTEVAAVPQQPSTFTITNSNYDYDEDNNDTDDESTNGQVYLDNVDNVLQEIREKAETVAANSHLLQDSSSEPSLTHLKSSREDIAWWKIAVPCIGILLVFPFLYYLYLEHLEYIHHMNSTASTETHNHNHYH